MFPPERSGPIAVDLCTGSGAIAIAIATEVPSATVHAVELSPEAHAWAARNVAAHGGGRVALHLADVRDLLDTDPESQRAVIEMTRKHLSRPMNGASASFRQVFEGLRGRVDVLVSNPPYVPESMVPRDPEVRDHDPELALYGGSDGLDLIRSISRVARDLVAPGGTIVLEHAEGQGAAIRRLLAADGWRDAETLPDLTGRDRATTALR